MLDNPRAIIADDEEDSRNLIRSSLLKVWPELKICAEAKNGPEALELIKQNQPDIAFLDIKMPGFSGMEVARKMTGSCRIVFITAYDRFAVEAFETAAFDYLLKPVSLERLEKSVRRLKQRLKTDDQPTTDLPEMIQKLIDEMPKKQKSNYLKWIRAQHGSTIRMILTDDVFYFKSSGKYTQIVAKDGEYLINKTIKQLEKELEPNTFWQIHRGTIINVSCIDKVSRSLTGRYAMKLKGIPDILTVSRNYTHLFKQM